MPLPSQTLCRGEIIDKVVDKVITRHPLACIVKTLLKCMVKKALGTGDRRLFSLDVEEWLDTSDGKEFLTYTGESRI